MAGRVSAKRFTIFIGELFFCAASCITLCRLPVAYLGFTDEVPVVVAPFVMVFVAEWGVVSLIRGILPKMSGLSIVGVPFMAVCFIACCLPAAIVLAVPASLSAFVVFTVCMAPAGVACVYFYAAWDSLGANFGSGNVKVITCVTFIGAAVLFAVSCALPLVGAAVEVVACMAASTVIMFAVWKGNYRPGADNAPDNEEARRHPTSLEELTDTCAAVAEAGSLSPRETEVLFYLARGRNAQHIAKELFVSEHTVKSHMYRIYKKLGVHTAQELIDHIEHFGE